jgi:hypothetical protein
MMMVGDHRRHSPQLQGNLLQHRAVAAAVELAVAVMAGGAQVRLRVVSMAADTAKTPPGYSWKKP